ncbi:MAG: hypothetical protein M1818_007703 [Claussenomyces sp. TS43310]|nr:MAG: hypothetical protein M1818_007703 [Claussenomyces sp. TS43310]
MATSKVIILTGASRGIGLSTAHYLLKNSHKLVVVARSAQPLADLKTQYPGQVETVAADLSDFSVAEKVTSLALKSFSRIDGLILCHGVLEPITRVSETNAEEWRKAFDVNFFSAVAFAKAVIPSLRESHGRIVLVSSGAATTAYGTWGAYGSSKAALNHLASTLKSEEPNITTMAIRPGVVDTAMQQAIRNTHSEKMDKKDADKFNGLHRDGGLLRPEQPGNVMARLVLGAPKELSGKALT